MDLHRGVFLDLETVDRGDMDRRGLAAALPQWDWYAYSDPPDIAARIQDAAVVITNKCLLGRRVLAGANRLRLIAVAATGTNNVDPEAARERGVRVCNIRNYCSDAVAQHAVTLMLNLLTGQPWYRDQVRQGQWCASRQFCLQDRPIREARGLNFGVIGYGHLGRATAQKAQALGMHVLIAERRGRPQRPGRVSFEEVLQRADVVSVHCPLTEETRNLIGRAELAAMKPDALLLNTARGGIVNESDLAAGLKNGQIGGAGLDTLSEEPPPKNHPLLADDIPNLLVTPHNAWASRTARQAALDQLAAVVAAFAAGAPVNIVA